jgi:hypothetical protein
MISAHFLSDELSYAIKATTSRRAPSAISLMLHHGRPTHNIRVRALCPKWGTMMIVEVGETRKMAVYDLESRSKGDLEDKKGGR